MRKVFERIIHPRIDKPGEKKGDIEAFPVIADQGTERSSDSGEFMEQGLLFVIIAHEDLRDPQGRIFVPAETDKKGIGPGTTGQTSRLNIEKERFPKIDGLRIAIRGEKGEAFGVPFQQGTQRQNAMMMVEREGAISRQALDKRGDDAIPFELLTGLAARR
jgi:hypothetical protein